MTAGLHDHVTRSPAAPAAFDDADGSSTLADGETMLHAGFGG